MSAHGKRIRLALVVSQHFEFINKLFSICLKTADVRVAPAGSTYGDIPYTVQSGGCGQPGEFIHMTPDYLRTVGDANNSAVFGPPGIQALRFHQLIRTL